MDQLQSMRQFVQAKCTWVKAVDEVIEEAEGSHGTLELSQVTPEPDAECQATHRARQQQLTVCESLPAVDNVLLTSVSHQLTDIEQTNLQVNSSLKLMRLSTRWLNLMVSLVMSLHHPSHSTDASDESDSKHRTAA